TFRVLSLAQLAQVAKTINSGLVAIAPAKVERVTPDDADVADFNIVRNTLGLQHALACPLVYTLRARTGAPQVSRVIMTATVVAPRDADVEIVFVLDLFRLNGRAASFHLLLLGKLETNISAGTKSHQTQQGRTELRHREVIVNRRDENDPEHDRPGKNLETMKAVTAAVGKNIAQKTAR